MYDIICASYDTPEKLKKEADYICDADDARPVLQQAIDEADALNVNCVLLRGTYVIASHGERSPHGGICFWNPEEKGRYYLQNRARYHVLQGAKIPLGYMDGAIITMSEEFYASLSDSEPFSLFYCDGNSRFGRGICIRNLVVKLPGSNKPVIVFDGSCAGNIRYEDTWVTSFDPCGKNLATAEGIPVPHPLSVAFRGCAGSNYYATEWKNLAAQGFGTGFDIGGEHVYCESLSALYNLTGFAFDCYKGKDFFEEPASSPSKGIVIYPIICVNLLDEHNVNMPRFGCVSHNLDPNSSSDHPGMGHEITILGMNVQWPNTCPGYTDRLAPDFTQGRRRAIEDCSGSWHGSIEYVIDHTTPNSGINLTDEPFFEEGHGSNILVRNLHNKQG